MPKGLVSAIPPPPTKPDCNACLSSTKRWWRKNNCTISWEIQKYFVYLRHNFKQDMRLEHIYGIIAENGFSDIALREINDYIKDIQDGTEDFPRFNLSEHAGLSKGGAPLIGASIIACYATASLTASRNAEGSKGNQYVLTVL